MHKLVHETSFSYISSDWFNVWPTSPFNQSAGSSHVVKKKDIQNNCRQYTQNTYEFFRDNPINSNFPVLTLHACI